MDRQRKSIQFQADWLIGGGEMGDRVRSMNWSENLLGPLSSWPQSLRVAVGICLGSRFPMHLCWGPDLVYIYNDAHVPILGDRHPEALGRSAPAIWYDIWPIIGPQFDAVIHQGESTWNKNVRVMMSRHGYEEETWFTWSYSPIRDETGNVVGLFCAATEETGKVLAEQLRNQTLNEVAEISAKFQAIYDQGLYAIFLDVHGMVTDANHSCVEECGYARTEVIDKTFWDCGWWGRSDSVRENIRDGFTRTLGGEPFQWEAPFFSPDGSQTFVEFALTPIKDAAGRVLHILAAGIDMTERKRLEQERLADHRQLALDAAKMGWWHYDPLTKNSSFDRRYTEIFGVAGHERPNEEIMKRLHPDDLSGVWAKVEAALDPVDPKPYTAEYRIILDDKSVRWIEAHGSASFEGSGSRRRATALVGTVADITDRKRADDDLRESTALLRVISDSTDDAIFAKDREGRLRFANPATLVLIGKPLEEVLGKTDADFLKDSAAARAVMENDQRIMDSGLPADIEETVPLPDGSLTVWFSRKTPNRDSTGKVIGLLGVSRDITEKKRAEEALVRQAEELARSNVELERFAYVSSHDLQEPMRTVRSFSQLLQRRYGNILIGDGADFLGFISSGVERMHKLINDLLAYSRVGSEGAAFATTDCNGVVAEVLQNLQASIDHEHAHVVVDPLPTLIADATQMGQVFQNLLGNAIKFHGPRPLQIHVSAEEEPTAWCFSVADNGIGIAPEYFDRIFVIFQRLHSIEEYGGTGIGLAICKQIVERHGGQIKLQSEPGKGSTFQFTIRKR